MTMHINRWLLVALLLVAAVIGAGGMMVSFAVNRYISTDAFCTSCHSVALHIDIPYFQNSAHRSNNEGVRASCGDCHVPTTNWFTETYLHVTSGVRDVYADLTNNFTDPKVWEARRPRLEQQARAEMRAQDSVTCRSCHDASAIKPQSDTGRQSHALLAQGGVTCVDCHTNLVHPPTASATQPGVAPTTAPK
jgi:nitrate/TMAO reductase-like tetraheme cytochrome c subunit